MSKEGKEITLAVECPFCGEKDFDLIGLKIHFNRGWCQVFEQTETIDRELEVKERINAKRSQFP